MKHKDHRDLVLEEFKLWIDSKVNSRTTLLDVGCKDGWFEEKLKQLGWHWVGLDIKSGEKNLIGAMENMPIPDDTIHVIFTSHTFEHSQNPAQALREFKRVLRGGGILFMVTPYPCKRQMFEMDKTHWFVLNEMQISRLLYLTGFVPVEQHVNKNESVNEEDWHIVTIANVI